MSYELNISTKNQITLPVSFLKDIGIIQGKQNGKKVSSKLVISKTFDGKFELVNPINSIYEILNAEPKYTKSLNNEELEKAINESRFHK